MDCKGCYRDGANADTCSVCKRKAIDWYEKKPLPVTLTVSTGRVIEASRSCSDFKRIAKIFWPEVFEGE